MMPLAAHPTNKNAVICFDLSADPEVLVSLTTDEIKQRVFSQQKTYRKVLNVFRLSLFI